MSSRVNATNTLIKSGYYSVIMSRYVKELKKNGGKVNKSKFYREQIVPLVPNYKFESFRKFAKRFELEAQNRLEASLTTLKPASGNGIEMVPQEANEALIATLQDSGMATRVGIAKALNIGMDALTEIIENTDKMSPKDRAELLFKAMKAQDSRIQATAKVRQDTREQVVFDQVFGEAAYAEENESYGT